MPSYDYRCTRGHDYTEIRSITDTSPSTCPKCEDAGERRYTSAPAIVFVGSGFAYNDR